MNVLNAAEHIAAIIDSADADAGQPMQVGPRWAAMTVQIGSEVFIVTIQPA